ncbi:hypothetical protein K443DRAFT_635534 [Laccaria amethystina LaAM-08-1]|uniref:Uncharacterized protein n=1 Tax=Laccaria amethystina LaAM-08-1 TaxID=1095629 RepID=A0A0C9X4U9_9AGAR|nr:hypothetical protein K443DRAFT_635534 [Laccaria amethystina LaAM-08-1]
MDPNLFLLQKGVPFANAVANVTFHGDKVVSYGSSFVDPKTAKIALSTPSLTWKSSLKHNSLEPTIEYLVKPNGSIALTQVLKIRNEGTNAWYEAFVDGHSGKLISGTDFFAHASVCCCGIQPSSRFTQRTVLPLPNKPSRTASKRCAIQKTSHLPLFTLLGHWSVLH